MGMDRRERSSQLPGLSSGSTMGETEKLPLLPILELKLRMDRFGEGQVGDWMLGVGHTTYEDRTG